MKYYKHNDEKSGRKRCCFGIVYKNDLYYMGVPVVASLFVFLTK